MGNYDYRTHDRVELADSYGKAMEFSYRGGGRICIGDTVKCKNADLPRLFKVRAFNSRGNRVILSNAQDGVVSVEPEDIDLVYRRGGGIGLDGR